MMASTDSTFSVCGMCTVRCPIEVETENGEIQFVRGNPHMGGINGALCARGAAGKALINDNERLQRPMIRVGDRGQGNWKPVSWDDALDHAAGRLESTIDTHGGRSVLFSDRGGPFRDLHQAFVRGLGSPNWSNHDSSCARNVQHAALSLFGFGRKALCYDLKNARHVVLQTRNIFEAINVKEVNDLMAAMEKGCKLTVVDIRANVSATKAHRFLMIRPGSDYALNLAVIHTLLNRNLYDAAYASKWIKDLDVLDRFVKPYTPEWAETETGIPAVEIVRFARDLAKDAPAVIWHPGWMNARYNDSFYMSRTIYIINALLGAIGARGGLPMANKPGDVDRKGLKKLTDLVPTPKEKRADGTGWQLGHLDSGPGLLHLGFDAIETETPYPVKAYIAYRHDPLMGYPDPDRLRQKWAGLDFLMSVSFTWSDTAWFSDLVLPLSPYLERESILACKNGLNPYLFTRRRAVAPRYDTRSDWEIICGLSKRLGIDALAFDSIEEIWNYQLDGTGVSVADFDARGFIPLGKGPLYRPEPAFKTPSGKVEIISERWESRGIPSLKPYAGTHPPEGQFRLTFGRCGVHTQGHTVNNSLLFEQVSENTLWIHAGAGAAMGLSDGDMVEVSGNGSGGRMQAKLTDLIHPEAVFMLHGFGHRLPVESRAFGKGVADHELMCGGLDKWDRGGGAMVMQEHYVTVSPC
ncbi:molybdopterin-dependent oxidoreductase [Desulfosarcina alkanivorans]|nr:molybdopterin-dependent oxidoreductase [Desulfosarcina alkanivorans]